MHWADMALCSMEKTKQRLQPALAGETKQREPQNEARNVGEKRQKALNAEGTGLSWHRAAWKKKNSDSNLRWLATTELQEPQNEARNAGEKRQRALRTACTGPTWHRAAWEKQNSDSDLRWLAKSELREPQNKARNAAKECQKALYLYWYV